MKKRPKTIIVTQETIGQTIRNIFDDLLLSEGFNGDVEAFNAWKAKYDPPLEDPADWWKK